MKKYTLLRSQNIGKVFQKNKLSKGVPSLLIHFYTPFLLLSFLPVKTFLIVKTKQKDKRCSDKCISAVSAVLLTLFANSDLKAMAKVNTSNDNFFYFYIIFQYLKHKISYLKFKCLFSDFVPKLRPISRLLLLLLLLLLPINCFVLVFYLVVEYNQTTLLELKFMS